MCHVQMAGRRRHHQHVHTPPSAVGIRRQHGLNVRCARSADAWAGAATAQLGEHRIEDLKVHGWIPGRSIFHSAARRRKHHHPKSYWRGCLARSTSKKKGRLILGPSGLGFCLLWLGVCFVSPMGLASSVSMLILKSAAAKLKIGLGL